MKRLTLLFLVSAVLLCSCGSRQLEEELMVIVLGVDAEEAKVTLTVKVPSAAAARNDEEDGYLTYSASGRGFADALSMLRAAAPRKMNFTQVREIVLGSGAASGALLPLLVQIENVPRLRCSAALIVCAQSAKEMIDAQKPDLGVRLSRWADGTLAESAGKGFTPDADLCAVLRDLRGGLADPLLIFGAVQPADAEGTLNEQNALDALPGSLPRRGAGKIELFGAAATDGHGVSGFLTGNEMALIHLLQGNIRFFPYAADSGALLRLTARSPARLTADLSAAPARLSLSLACDAHCPPGAVPDPDALAEALRQEIRALLSRLQALNCDALGFGEAAARQFLTLGEWERIGWRNVYATAEIDVTVSVRCLTD